jgi:hypothetical protein
MNSLEALLAGIVDYAGLFPPAALSLEETCANYDAYLRSGDAWMLNRLVLPVAKLRTGEGWRISLLVEDEPGPLPPQVETLETKLPRRLSLPTYCEAPVETIESGFAKIRTGGLTADAIPSSAQVADFLCAAAARRLPFKATAGLHHAVRAEMHGFLNVFVAAALAWHGAERSLVLEVLDERKAASFAFGEDALRWREHSLSTAQVHAARRDFAHSFGSCSFTEPVAELRELGLLA